MKIGLDRLRESRHTREAAGLVLIAVGLLCLGALFSYSAADPSWFSRSTGATGAGDSRNWFGWLSAGGKIPSIPTSSPAPGIEAICGRWS